MAIRKALETLAVRYAALRITADELLRLEELLAQADSVFTQYIGDELLERFFPIVKSFNHTVFEACRSTSLTAIIWAQREIFDRYRVMRIILPNRIHKSLSRRKDLYAALRDGDPDRACAVWTDHLNESFTIWRDKSGYGKELEGFTFF
jgi:DNA-binding FadR family transcriptional regulator